MQDVETLQIDKIHDLIPSPQSPPSATPVFRGLIVGEAHRLFDDNLAQDESVPTIPDRQAVFHHLTARLDSPAAQPATSPGVTVWQLSLDLMSEQEAVMAVARRALAGHVEAGGQDGEVDETLVGIIERVEALLARIPECFHTCTSGKVSPIRKAMRQLQEVHRRHPTSPELLGFLAMILVRLDRAPDYEELLEEARSLEEHAISDMLRGLYLAIQPQSAAELAPRQQPLYDTEQDQRDPEAVFLQTE